MTSIDRYRGIRRGYYRRVELAVLGALAVHAAAFALAPPYVPRPYQLATPPPQLLLESEPAASALAAPLAIGPRPPARAGVVSPAAAPIVSEQLERIRPEVGGREGAAAGVDPPHGAGAFIEPPVFYAYDTAPRATRRVEPEYPLVARAQGLEGTVVVNANIDERGQILRAWVVESTAAEILVAAALDAVYQFEFAPGRANERAVKCTVAIPFRFSIRRP